jgi:hypothetical protein
LHERGAGGEDEVGQAQTGDEEEENVPGRGGAGDGCPRFTRGDGEKAECEGEEEEVKKQLAAGREPSVDGMGVGVAAEEEDLEEEHAGGPYFGAAAVPREDESGDEGFDEEEEERAGEYGQPEEKHSENVGAAGG